MRSSGYFENLRRAVVDNSVSNTWEKAVLEWEIVDCREAIERDKEKTTCVCGKENLVYLFTIRNTENGNELFPIGSTCINRFNRDELDNEISVYMDMFKLIHAVENKEFIELTSKYFTRKLIDYLYDNDVFQANKYNGFDAENDYWFIMDMFNKRNKDEIEDSYQRKINAIIKTNIIPFVRSKIKIATEAVAPNCPKCGAKMKLRVAHKGTENEKEFWGCSNYPECKGTKSK